MNLPSAEIYVLAHPDHFRRALVTDIDSFGKTADYQRAFGNGLLSTEGNQWRRQRDVLQPLFHGIESTTTLARWWKQRSDGSIPVT
jgi:cytochrome P450